MTAAGFSRAPSPGRGQRALLTVFVDLVAPVGLYYILRAAGAGVVLALVVTSVAPGLSETVRIIRCRQHDGLALFMIMMTALGIGAAFLTGSARFLLIKDGCFTGLAGALFLASLRARRPLAYQFSRPLLEGRKAFGTRSWEELWDRSAAFRRIWRVSTIMWGAGLVLDMVIRVLFAVVLPVNEVPALGGVQYAIFFVLMQVITNIYYWRSGLWEMLGAPLAAPPRVIPAMLRPRGDRPETGPLAGTALRPAGQSGH